MKRLIIDLADQAPVDQLLWSVWGFCVLEDTQDAELELACSEQPTLPAGLETVLGVTGGVAVSRGVPRPPDPDAEFVLVSSAAPVSRRLLEFSSTLHVCPAGELGRLAPDWYWDAAWMARFRQLAGRLSGEVLDSAGQAAVEQHMDRLRPSDCRISLISSVFKADRFLPHFLDNCSQLEGYAQTEHWLIRPGSPGNEHSALLDHVWRWPGAIYLNMAQDPGLYATWNLACCLAQGRYLSNANVDDRRHRQQLRRLAEILDERPAVDLASAALRVTAKANQELGDCASDATIYEDVDTGEYGLEDLIRVRDGMICPHNVPDCMPVWRRALHLLHGFFNERMYGPSADCEFWLRCAARGARYHHSPQILGLYQDRQDSYWHGHPKAEDYDLKILDRYRPLAHGESMSRGFEIPPQGDLTRFVQTGGWLGVLLNLARMQNVQTAATRIGEGRKHLIDALARHYFGVSGQTIQAIDLPAKCSQTVLGMIEGPLYAAFLSFLEHTPAHQAGFSPRAAHWHRLLVDWHLVSGSDKPLAGLALLNEHARAAGAA